MGSVLVYTLLVIVGLLGSQFVPLLGKDHYYLTSLILKQTTMLCLSFIMIHVGLEFHIAKNRLKEYGKDYLIAFTTATFPWLFCSLYFVYNIPHNPSLTTYQIWSESLLVGRFAAPTSAGVLFTMLTAAGLAGTWVFRKARILAIFDDVDTILLMIPLKMLLLGGRWELFMMLAFPFGLLLFAWKKMHLISLPLNWYWILLYSVLTVAICEGVYILTESMDNVISIHLEVILPAFVIGCVLAYPKGDEQELHKLFHEGWEKKVQKSISAVFIFLVGLSTPPILMGAEAYQELQGLRWWEVLAETPRLIYESNKTLPISTILVHTFIITILSNVGKMFPAFCYSREASLRERLALALGMCPRGEVGAGIIVVSLSLVTDLESPIITIAMLSLALNLALTGPIIVCIRKLLVKE